MTGLSTETGVFTEIHHYTVLLRPLSDGNTSNLLCLCARRLHTHRLIPTAETAGQEHTLIRSVSHPIPGGSTGGKRINASAGLFSSIGFHTTKYFQIIQGLLT